MEKIKDINIDILPAEIKRELIDFYEYLVKKYVKKKDVEIKKRKEVFFDELKKHSFKLPVNYKFDREELHER